MENNLPPGPTKYVENFHNVPRFGHTRSIARLFLSFHSDDYNTVDITTTSNSNSNSLIENNNASEFNNVSEVTSPYTIEVDKNDYNQGLYAFSIFICTFIFMWIIILFVLKYYYTYEVVGWAAGGDVVNVRYMKKCGIKKSERKRRIIRNWRIQTIFLFCNIMVPPITFCLFEFGINPFILISLNDIIQVNDMIDSTAYVGISIINDIIHQTNTFNQLYETNHIYNTIMMNNNIIPIITSSSNDTEKSCPISNFMSLNNQTTTSSIINNFPLNHKNDRRKLPLDFKLKPTTNHSLNGTILLQTSNDIIQYLVMVQESVVKEMNSDTYTTLYNTNYNKEDTVFNIIPFLEQVTVITHSIENGIDTIYHHDWIIKLFAMIFNICSIFMIIGVILVKNNITWPAYRFWCIYLLVPIFTCTLIAMIYMTCIFIMIAMMNSDFCMGGGSITSNNTDIPIQFYPVNTIHDMISMQGYKSNSILHQSFQYYGTSCLSENPFLFLEGMQLNVSIAQLKLQELYEPLRVVIENRTYFSEIMQECGEDGMLTVQGAADTIDQLLNTLQQHEGSFNAAIDMSSCSSISPILRRLTYGATCATASQDLSWAFATLFVLTIAGLIIITLRSALYSTVIRGRRQKRREKEWEDYKVFMSRYYDVTHWKIDPASSMTPEKLYATVSDDGTSGYIKNDEDNNEQLTLEEMNEMEAYGSSPAYSDDSTASYCSNNAQIQKSSILKRTQFFDNDYISDDASSLAPTIEFYDEHDPDGKSTATFVNLTAPDVAILHESKLDDDDDSYDSTYSTDSEEDDDHMGMSVASSVASSFVRRFLLSRSVKKERFQTIDRMLSTTSFSPATPSSAFNGATVAVQKYFKNNKKRELYRRNYDLQTNQSTYEECITPRHGSVISSSSSCSMSICDMPTNSPSSILSVTPNENDRSRFSIKSNRSKITHHSNNDNMYVSGKGKRDDPLSLGAQKNVVKSSLLAPAVDISTMTPNPKFAPACNVNLFNYDLDGDDEDDETDYNKDYVNGIKYQIKQPLSLVGGNNTQSHLLCTQPATSVLKAFTSNSFGLNMTSNPYLQKQDDQKQPNPINYMTRSNAHGVSRSSKVPSSYYTNVIEKQNDTNKHADSVIQSNPTQRSSKGPSSYYTNVIEKNNHVNKYASSGIQSNQTQVYEKYKKSLSASSKPWRDVSTLQDTQRNHQSESFESTPKAPAKSMNSLKRTNY